MSASPAAQSQPAQSQPAQSQPAQSQPAEAPFHDLDAYLRLRRLGTIALALDGRRLVAAAADLNAEQTGYTSALWEVDVDAQEPARRITRSVQGESAPVFCPDGSLLFTSARPGPPPAAGAPGTTGQSGPNDQAEPADPVPALWRLPVAGGEAARVAERAGGIGTAWVARISGTVALTADVLSGSVDDADDRDRRAARAKRKISAILHAGYPVRHWDHDLGPAQPRLFATANQGDLDADEPLDLADLTPEPSRALDDAEVDIAPTGQLLVTTWTTVEDSADLRTDLVAIDCASGHRRTVAADPGYSFGSPAISPDGQWVACMRARRSSPTEPVDQTLWLVPLGAAEGSDEPAPGRALAPDLDLWPGEPSWSPDGRTVYFVADERGHAPVFAADVESGQVHKLTEHGAYGQLQVCPTGRFLYAVRTGYTEPASIVRIDLTDPSAEPLMLRGPAECPALPGRLTEVHTTAADGTALRAWLALPDSATPDTPAPLLLWVHGGPLSSWNTWSWRWNPWLLVARGYAVLLPDPALSTGYGQQMIRRGWGAWGQAPFTDLMCLTDAALEREDTDRTRTAAMGGSFGGYMANWIAGHTDRFDAIVTHASLWSLDQFGATTDLQSYWRHEMSGERAAANSPDTAAASIDTPMLVVHGDHDYRVPIGEGLRLWWDLVSRHDGDPATLPHRFLYFPDENHWVLAPQHARLWYETVFAFLAWHVLGQDWHAPELV